MVSERILRLRLVQAEDCRMIWEWANDPTTRAVSFTTESISWESHVRWFSAKLSDPNCLFFVALDSNDVPIGQVRFAMDGPEAVISVSLAFDQRGKGYGSQIIRKATQRVFASTAVRLIHAYIRPENIQSIQAFIRAGFLDNGLIAMHKVPARDYTIQRESKSND